MTCLPSCKEYTYEIDHNLVTWSISNKFQRNIFKEYLNRLTTENDSVRLQLLNQNVNYGHPVNYDLKEYYHGIHLNSAEQRLSLLNFVLVNNDLPVTKEVMDYTNYQLLSDIGGQLGLWIRMSVITLLEIGDLMCDLMKYLCCER